MDPWRGQRSYNHEWYPSENYVGSQYSSYRPPSIEQYPHDYQDYEEEIYRPGPEDVPVYEEELVYRPGTEAKRCYYKDVPLSRELYRQDYGTYEEELYRPGPEDVPVYEEESIVYRQSSEDDRYYYDDVELPDRYYHEEGTSFGARSYSHDRYEESSYSVHHNDSAEDTTRSRYQHDTFIASGDSRYPHGDFDRQRFQSCPVPAQRIRNLPAGRTDDGRPIPTIHGQGFNRSPSKKWSGQRGSPQKANKIINRSSTTPGRQFVGPAVPISQQLGSHGKGVAMPSATASSGHRPQGNRFGTLPLATLKGNQLSSVRPTVNQQSKTGSEGCQQSATQSTNPLTKLDGQSCLKSAGSLLPTCVSSASSSSQSTLSGKGVSSSLPESLHQIDKRIEQDRKDGKISDSVLNKIEEKQDRPKVLVEVELIEKLEGIELGTNIKERMETKDLSVKETDSKAAPHEDTGQDECGSEVDNKKKNVNKDGVNIAVVLNIENSSNTAHNENDVSCYERAEVEVQKDSLDLNEEVNDKSENVIIRNKENQGAKTEKDIAVDKDMLQKRTNNETETCTTNEHGHILGEKSSITETVKSSAVANKLETEASATENMLAAGVNETDISYSEGNEDVKNIKKVKPDMLIKPSDMGNKDAKCVKSRENAIDSLTTDKKEKEERKTSVSDLHKRVLEKMISKFSLISDFHERVLEKLNSKSSKEDVKSINEGKPDMMIKSSDMGNTDADIGYTDADMGKTDADADIGNTDADMVNTDADIGNTDAKWTKNGDSAIDRITTDKTKKEEMITSVSDLHKRVLEKMNSKASLVKKVNDHSLRLLENSKTLSSSGSFIEPEKDDTLMEVDESFNNNSYTDSNELNASRSSTIENTECAEESYNFEKREMYNINFDQSLSEIDEMSLDESLPCMNETGIEDTSIECTLDTSKSSEVTEQNSAVEENIEMMSEYTVCSTNILGGESERGFGNVECSDISAPISANVEIVIKDSNNRDSLNIDDAKLENVEALGVFDVDEFRGVVTNNMVDVNFESNDTINIDAVVGLEKRDIHTVDAKLEEMDTDNVLSNAKLECKHSLKVDAAVKLESRDNSSMANDNTLGNKDNHDMDDEDDHFEAVEIFENEALTANEGLEDSELRKKYNIKEAFVSLGKIDDKEVEVDEQQSKVKDQQSEEGDQYIEVDDLQRTVDEQQNELKDQPSELNGQDSEVDDQGTQNDQESKLEDQQKETEDKTEESVKTDNHEQPVYNHILDKESRETVDITANMMPSPMKDVDKGRPQEKVAVTPDRGQRQVVPLSERFGQLDYRPEVTDTEIGTDETVYKAEFENIVNKLNKRSGLKDQSGSKTDLEDMDVSEPKGDDTAKESERANKKDMETSYSVRSIIEETGGKNEVGNVANPIPSGSSKDVKERTQPSDGKKVPSPSSPDSFLDYSDESDDELLVTPSAFLRSVEEINGRPVVITPTKVMDSSQNSTATTSSSDLSPLKPVPQRPGLKNKFTLDGLLADHEEKADLVREMDEIDQELQDEIRQGGFVNILNKEDAAAADSQITEEQKEMLKQFEVEESCICEDRPGVLVFDPRHYQCLFTRTLCPTDCGFTVGSNGLSLEKHLESLTPAQCKRVITSGIISQCFTKISCQTPLMRWLFFIMSVHDDYQVQQGCKKILLEILHFQHIYRLQKWAPRLVDVLSVLVNYGAALESLIPCGSSTLEIISGKLIHEPDYIHQPVPQNAGMNTENLILVLQILAQCLHGPSGRYSPNDLSLLCVALCKASLDTSLKNLCAKGAFQNCITMVIRQYLEADWLKERLKLTRMLVSITDHHHNSAHVAELFPPGARGMFLQRRFCYLVLSEILLDKTNVSDELLNSIQIKDLERFIPKIKELLENDSYKLSSVVTLIDLCVGVHMTLNSEQREQLKCLFEQVRRVRVRDNVSMLDRTRVKDMIVRMTSKWALDIQTMKGKQTKIFEYASPVKMHIERVHALQSSGEEEEEHSDSDNDLPCKIQKLSPDLNT